MGHFSNYMKMSIQQIEKERKQTLTELSKYRKRDVLVYASAINQRMGNDINYYDILPIREQLEQLTGKSLDFIIETPGGSVEIVEDIVRSIRIKYDDVSFIIPGHAKSAGTVLVLSGDDIMMGPYSALGPIDAQILQGGKRFSADGFLQKLQSIRDEIDETGKLHPIYIPILSNLHLGEIQQFQNARELAIDLAKRWLPQYKFKYWKVHSTTGKPVSDEEKINRAKEISEALCDQGTWKSHGRSITMEDLRRENIKLKITDYSQDKKLNDLLSKYYALMQFTFMKSGDIVKIFESPNIFLYMRVQTEKKSQMEQIRPPKKDVKQLKVLYIDITCNNCSYVNKVQADLEENNPLKSGFLRFPKDNQLKCKNCGKMHNIANIREKIEKDTGKKIY